jgi:hypothetical protein
MKYTYMAILSLLMLNNAMAQEDQKWSNPDISLILNGKYQYNKNSIDNLYDSTFSIDESELGLSANVDNKFFGETILAINDGELAIEEAYIVATNVYDTKINISVGRKLWELGYLNSKHPHADSFATRPVAFEFFLGGYNSDGVAFSYILPTSFYSEVGGGTHGLNYSSEATTSTYSLYFRTGGDITQNQDFRIGGYVLLNDTEGHFHTEEGDEHSHSHTSIEIPAYEGSYTTYMVDLKYNLAINESSAFSITAEGYMKEEDGEYEHSIEATEQSYGYYVNGVYKINKNFATGIGYSQVFPKSLDLAVEGAYEYEQAMAMISYNNSEFSTIRLQYDFTQYNAFGEPEIEKNHSIILQYVMSLGSHKAHSY